MPNRNLSSEWMHSETGPRSAEQPPAERRGRRAVPAILAALTLASFASDPARAVDYVDAVNIVQQGFVSAPLRVAADANGYTQILTSSVTYPLTISGSCTVWGKADQSDVWIYRGDGSNYRAQTTDWGWNRRDVSRIVDVEVDLTAAEKQKVVKACQDYLAQRVAQGAQPFQILREDHSIAGPQLYRARHTFGCTGNLHLTGGSAYREIDLIQPLLCQKAPAGSLAQPPPPRPPLVPPGPPNLAVPFAVTGVSLHAVPSQQTTEEEVAKVKFQGEIEVNREGLVVYRIRQNGALGPISKLGFSSQGSKPVDFTIDVPCRAPAPGGTLTTQPGGSPGGFAAPTAPGVKSGSAQLVIVEPPSHANQSDLAFYQVRCKPKSPVAGGGTLVTPLPDLVIQSFALQGASGGKAVVRNVGAAGSGATQIRAVVTVDRRRAQVFSASVPPLAPGASDDVKVLFPGLVTGQVTSVKVTLRVDDPSVVAESNEGNNGFSFDQ